MVTALDLTNNDQDRQVDTRRTAARTRRANTRTYTLQGSSNYEILAHKLTPSSVATTSVQLDTKTKVPTWRDNFKSLKYNDKALHVLVKIRKMPPPARWVRMCWPIQTVRGAAAAPL